MGGEARDVLWKPADGVCQWPIHRPKYHVQRMAMIRQWAVNLQRLTPSDLLHHKTLPLKDSRALIQGATWEQKVHSSSLWRAFQTQTTTRYFFCVLLFFKYYLKGVMHGKFKDNLWESVFSFHRAVQGHEAWKQGLLHTDPFHRPSVFFSSWLKFASV